MDAAARGRYLRGLGMILLTTLLWGILPILQKVALNRLSAGSIVWFRFLCAFAILYPLLHFGKRSPAALLKRPPVLGLVAGVCLAGNYFGVVQGIELTGPTHVAILIQLAPALLVIAGMLIFKERISRVQALGFLVAGFGFFLFFKDKLAFVTDTLQFHVANAWVIFGAVAWVVFMICQKNLSEKYGAQSLNLLVYGVAALALMPTVSWADFENLSFGYWALMALLGLNTLFAYGALAEAVRCIPLAHISVVTAVNPLITMAVVKLMNTLEVSWIPPEHLGTMGVVGALIAVAGVVLVVRRA